VGETIESLLQTADQGRILREGIRTVICGEPNVGKSSLLNLLLGYERAIVSEIPGTTRDTIEEVINLRGIPVRLVDTAGLRASSDSIEQQGMARTLKHIETADLVLRVADGSRGNAGMESDAGKNEILVLNKCDLGLHESQRDVRAVRISCKTTEGLEALAEAIFTRVMGGHVNTGDFSAAINARHQVCLQKALQSSRDAGRAMREALSAEFISIELHSALDAVGEVVGKADSEELLGRIFSTFCIGK